MRILLCVMVLGATVMAAGGPVGAPATRPSWKVAYVVRGVVEKVVPLVHFQGKARVTGIDPRFAVVIKQMRVIEGAVEVGEDRMIVFAIHSPAQTFTGETVAGGEYEFTVSETDMGKGKFYVLSVEKLEASTAPAMKRE